jgi:phosphoglycolate phosphatase-like HAD superfamily hydrolase
MTSMNGDIKAIIWDYDGTLCDTRPKNLNVTRKIIEHVTNNSYSRFHILNDIEEFKAAHGRSTNWRSFYRNEFGFNEKEIDETGVHWTPFQVDDTTDVPFFDGILEVINTTGSVPHGIVSQNSSKIIHRQISECDMAGKFQCIIGYEEVDLQRQKPHPEGLLNCIDKLTDSDSGKVIYIGDHETDTICVRNAAGVLKKNGSRIEIVSIAALYDNMIEVTEWKNQPDFTADSPAEIINIIKQLS